MKIKLKVYPNSPNEEIIEVSEEEYRIYLKKPAEKNKANLELIKLLSKYFNVNQKNIIIKSGMTSRDKLIEIK